MRTEITVQPTVGATHFDPSVVLEGKRYVFAFYTNKVTGGWCFDLKNDAGDAEVKGLAITNGIDLLDAYRHLDLPPGPLFVFDVGLDGADPDLEAFADGRAKLVYVSSDDPLVSA